MRFKTPKMGPPGVQNGSKTQKDRTFGSKVVKKWQKRQKLPKSFLRTVSFQGPFYEIRGRIFSGFSGFRGFRVCLLNFLRRLKNDMSKSYMNFSSLKNSPYKFLILQSDPKFEKFEVLVPGGFTGPKFGSKMGQIHQNLTHFGFQPSQIFALAGGSDQPNF